MKQLKKYEFIQAISDAVGTALSMSNFLKQLPGIIQRYLPLKRSIIFYKSETGNHFNPYSEEFENNRITPLDEKSNIIRSFVSHRRAIILDKEENIYQEIFNKNSDHILERYDLNVVIPLYCRRYSRGLLLSWLDPKKKGFFKDLEQVMQTAADIFIPIIETERLEVENDRNYYRLFKFDRLVLLGEMVASIAHELKTPMNTVLLEVQEMHDMLNDQKGMDQTCKKIKKEITRINQFIRSLLSFSKFKEISNEELALNEFVQKTLKDIPRKRIPADLKIAPHLENNPVVFTDRNRLHQVFLNILFNAFDAAGTGGEISIKTYSEHKETDKDMKHYIAIRDSGPGISDEIKEKILEPFFTTKQEGTGLGLYISYGIMRSLKGDLEIESSAKGTTVYIILPGD